MMNSETLLSGTFSLAFLVFVVVVSVLWIILPFALFGIKGRLDSLITELQKMNENIKDLRRSEASQIENNVKITPD